MIARGVSIPDTAKMAGPFRRAATLPIPSEAMSLARDDLEAAWST